MEYGDCLETGLQNPVLGRANWVKHVPALGRYVRINIGPVRMSGSPTSVKQTTKRLGASLRFIADTSNWDHSMMNATVGRSGQIMSLRYSDQWEATTRAAASSSLLPG